MFYLKPPAGQIYKHILEKCLFQRYTVLSMLDNNQEITQLFEYLIDGTAYDRTSHFCFRLLSVKYSNLNDFFIRNEIKLFECRFNVTTVKFIQKEFKVIVKHCTELLDKCKFNFKRILLADLKYLCEQYSNKKILQHLFNSKHLETCKKLSFKVSFTTCLSLVRSLQVDLKQGQATTYCGQWKNVLKSIFEEHLYLGLKEIALLANEEHVFDTKEFEELESLYTNVFSVLESYSRVKLSFNGLNETYDKFPPCMQHLHNTLLKTHRLYHEDRFNLTLFLKDIGMPLDDSILYWRKEYSKKTRGCGCSHNWQENEKKFVYSIRHMYGLEGGRKNYICRSCQKLQEGSISVRAEGGCPFKYFDDSKLSKILVNIQPEEKNNILKIRNTDPLNACRVFFKYSNKENDMKTNWVSPVEYYKMLLQK